MPRKIGSDMKCINADIDAHDLLPMMHFRS
jgi:hypothetical protein